MVRCKRIRKDSSYNNTPIRISKHARGHLKNDPHDTVGVNCKDYGNYV